MDIKYLDEEGFIISMDKADKGVCYHKNRKRWVARGWNGSVQVHLGTFRRVYDANLAVATFNYKKLLEERAEMFKKLGLSMD